MLDRVLPWEGCLNVRDLGGLPTADGRTIRRAALVRSDTLCRLSSAGRISLIEHGVRTIVDVRFPNELARDDPPHPFRDGADGLSYTNAPINAGRTDEENAAIVAQLEKAQSRAELNRIDLDGNPTGFSRIVQAVARAAPGGVLIHCHAGKDRTGISVALILAVLGVADELIADDYGLSRANLAGLTREWLDGITHDPAERARLMRQSDPSPETMLELLAHLRDRHGGAERYLLSGGATAEELTALRDRLLDPI